MDYDTIAKKRQKWAETKTAFWWAIHNGDVEKARMMLDSDKRLANAEFDLAKMRFPVFWYPLHNAVEKKPTIRGNENSLEMAELLIERGANVNNPAQNQMTPLHIAAANTDAKYSNALVMLLLERKADPNARDRENKTPLHYAAEAGKYFAIVELLDHVAFINAADAMGRTPLDLVPEEQSAIKSLLERNGAIGGEERAMRMNEQAFKKARTESMGPPGERIGAEVAKFFV